VSISADSLAEIVTRQLLSSISGGNYVPLLQTGSPAHVYGVGQRVSFGRFRVSSDTQHHADHTDWAYSTTVAGPYDLLSRSNH
jgi:hypothetical protein